jgi:hemoglobin-like flavoprotein
MHVTRHPLIAARSLAKVPPDETIIQRLEASYASLAARSSTLALSLHDELSRERPEVRARLPRDLAALEAQLLSALDLVVRNLRAPDVIREQLADMGRSHRRAGVDPSQYPGLVAALVRAFARTDTEGWSDEIANEWRIALGLICALMSAEP